MATALGSAMDFLKDFGFFDVILPFLLVFTIVFAILEKTRIFGSEEIDGKPYPKKNLNAMIAFVMGFFVVAARQVVESLQVSLPNVALVLIIAVSFMMLAGSFMGDETFSFKGKWAQFLTLIMFIAVVLIFLNSLGWLDVIIDFINKYTGEVLVPAVLIIVILLAIFFVVGGKPKAEEKKEE
ncbi:MAG: hypothetical protein KKA65_00880 [Nanoarchaeota archaeon]|nr:hypothetical protein [Nanoarchaeota archaeon]MBU4352276.1 hypothetical protein [Nanoarchaeota archaeon]MBU4456032.1 hypothetical protein [Nanoarchaeota archaeon]MCG2719542.1 hypothetical protein [Nanoarchaeota archaeon]